MYDLNGEDALLAEQSEPADDPPRCDLCGESIETDRYGFPREEVGEFVDTDGEHVYAHAQCGLDAELELA